MAEAAPEQRRAQVFLQCRDLPADRRLREEAFAGCPGERQVARRRVEDGQTVQRRQTLRIFLHAFQECVDFRMIV